MGKTYYGFVEENPENPKETVNVVHVAIRGEGSRVVREYNLEPAHVALGKLFFNGYSWGYRGEGPKALAEAILFDYTSDVEKTRKYRNALIDCEIQHLDNGRGFILGGDCVEVAIRFADRQREEERRRERQSQIRMQMGMWRRSPRLAIGALARWAKDAYSEHEHVTWAIGVVIGLLGIVLALV